MKIVRMNYYECVEKIVGRENDIYCLMNKNGFYSNYIV